MSTVERRVVRTIGDFLDAIVQGQKPSLISYDVAIQLPVSTITTSLDVIAPILSKLDPKLSIVEGFLRAAMSLQASGSPFAALDAVIFAMNPHFYSDVEGRLLPWPLGEMPVEAYIDRDAGTRSVKSSFVTTLVYSRLTVISESGFCRTRSSYEMVPYDVVLVYTPVFESAVTSRVDLSSREVSAGEAKLIYTSLGVATSPTAAVEGARSMLSVDAVKSGGLEALVQAGTSGPVSWRLQKHRHSTTYIVPVDTPESVHRVLVRSARSETGIEKSWLVTIEVRFQLDGGAVVKRYNWLVVDRSASRIPTVYVSPAPCSLRDKLCKGAKYCWPEAEE